MSRVVSLFVVLVLSVILVAATSVFGKKQAELELVKNSSSSALSSVSTSSSSWAGGFLGANNALFTTFRPVINQLLNQEVKTFKIANVNQDSHDVSFDITSISITSFSCNDCVSLSIADNYIGVSVSDLSASLHFDYAAEWKKIIHIHAHGHCSPSVSDISVSAHAAFGPPSSAGTPTIKVSNLDVHIGHLSAHCSGITGFVIDAVTDVIKTFFLHAMEKILTNVLEKELNKELEKIKLQTSIDGGFAIADFSIVPTRTTIANNQINIGIKGQIYPAANPSIVFPFPAPTAFKNFCSGNQVQVALSSYTLNTGYYSYYFYDRMHATFPSVLKAGDVHLVLPGFAKNLGKDAELNLTFDASNYATFSTNASSNTFNLNAPFNMTLSGPRGNYFYTLAITAVASVSLTVSTSNATQPKLMLQIPDVQLINPKVVGSNVGGGSGFAADAVVIAIDAILKDLVLRPINYFLSKTGGIPLPSFDGFEISNPQIAYNNDGVCIALNIKQQL